MKILEIIEWLCKIAKRSNPEICFFHLTFNKLYYIALVQELEQSNFETYFAPNGDIIIKIVDPVAEVVISKSAKTWSEPFDYLFEKMIMDLAVKGEIDSPNIFNFIAESEVEFGKIVRKQF